MLALALILDAIFGEPDALWQRVPHPAVLMGRAIDWADRRFNDRRRVSGALSLAAMIAVTWAAAALVSNIPLGSVIGAAVLLAHRSLVDHVGAVATGLREGLAEGRAAVALIVGRDPDTLDEAGVARAAIESAAENFSDGVVAPAFWFAVGGLPGIAVYKLVNTADSMIGHRSEAHEAFGWAAARLDDLMNWIPARLAGFLFCLAGGGRPAWEVMRRDASGHKSVNAGWPEAAMAASLGVALAGPRSYGGRLTDDPWQNGDGRREVTAQDIEAAVALLWRTWALLLAIAVAGWLLI